MTTATKAPYQDQSLPIDDRVSDLLGRMTLAEKIAQLGARMPFDLIGPDGFTCLSNGVGHIATASSLHHGSIEDMVAFGNSVQKYLAEQTRLGIPAIAHEEALVGLVHSQGTSFPSPLSLASTWSPGLVEKMGHAIGMQARAVGVHQVLAPVLDVARDARWGRVPETYGEDPHLCGEIGAAYVRGVQSDTLASAAIATAKHFLGYAASEGGRNIGSVTMSQQQLHEVYGRPFKRAIDAGLGSIMSAYHEINGEPASGSASLLSGLLRDAWGFEGTVVADYGSIRELATVHHVADGVDAAALRAFTAGLDIELPTSDLYGQALEAAVRAGTLSEATIDTSVARILRQKFALGLFENPYASAETARVTLSDPEPADLALQLATESLVLLKNDGTLPLAQTLNSVAVIGPAAHDARFLFTGYTYPAGMELQHAIMEGIGGSMAGFSTDDAESALGVVREVRPMSHGAQARLREILHGIPTVLEALADQLPAGVHVTHAAGCSLTGPEEEIAAAVAVAAAADVAVVVLGDKTGWSYDATGGEHRDRTSLELPGHQATLLRSVCATGTPVVVVLLNGRPMPLPEVSPAPRAILQAWQPGASGAAAIAQVLTGAAEPGGRLPITIPRTAGQCPLYYGHKPGGSYESQPQREGQFYTDVPGTPAWPFGYGRSYTTFEYARARVTPLRPSVTDGFTAEITVTNTGGRAGTTVVQIYGRRDGLVPTRPVKELIAFQRATLEPGETRLLQIPVSRETLAVYDNGWHVPAGDVELLFSTSSSHAEAAVKVTLAP